MQLLLLLPHPTWLAMDVDKSVDSNQQSATPPCSDYDTTKTPLAVSLQLLLP